MLKSAKIYILSTLAIASVIGILMASSSVKAIESSQTTTETQVVTTEPKVTTTEPKTVNPEPRTTPTVTTNEAGLRAKRLATEQSQKIAKLETAKLKICQSRETEIKNTLARITDRNNKRLDTFDKIATRVEDFYITKGKTLINYDQLVKAVDDKKVLVQDAILKVSSTTTTFTCGGDDPKGVVSEFKSADQAINNAMKEYKTAIKNLIVGVKSVQGTTTSETNKTTPGGQ